MQSAVYSVRMTAHRSTTGSRTRPILASIAAALVLLVGCAAGPDLSDSSANQADLEVSGPDSPNAATDKSVGGADQNRSVIVTGAVELTAADPIATASEIAASVEKAGGRVEARSENEGTDDSPGSATLTVRLPPGEVQTMIETLRGLADVAWVDLKSTDVTMQVTDLDTRISAKRAAITRLEEILAGAGSMSDLLEVEGELTTRQTELEVLLAEQAGLTDSTSMATLEISLYGAKDAPVDDAEPAGFLGGLSNGWGALVATFKVVVTVLGTVLPWAVVLGVLTGGAWWVVRRVGHPKS